MTQQRLLPDHADLRQRMPFLVQFGLYVSPVGFSSAIVPEKWQLLLLVTGIRQFRRMEKRFVDVI